MIEPISTDRARYRSASACGCLIACVVLLGLVPRANADDAPSPSPSPLTATMQCDRAAEPGRVKCSVEVRSAASHTISWADVAIVELPEFTSALKGRIGPADATIREATTQKWAFGLVAKKAGQGEAKARVRAVVCESTAATPGKEAGSTATTRCNPQTVEVKTQIIVG